MKYIKSELSDAYEIAKRLIHYFPDTTLDDLAFKLWHEETKRFRLEYLKGIEFEQHFTKEHLKGDK